MFAAIAPIAAFDRGREWLEELREYLWENRKFAEDFIREEIPELRTVSADATYLLWIDCCAGDDGQDDFRTACADAAAADGDAGHDNYLTEKRYFHHTACPAACQACRSKNRKQVVFCGNLHLRDGRKSFTISAAKAVRPAWGCAAFFVLGGKESGGNENDCAGAGGLSGS